MLSSSLGRKLVMAVTGAFLIIFLIAHLSGNLLLFKDDGGVAFNTYAHFMGTSPLVRVVEILLFASILFHFLQGLGLAWTNSQARPQRYLASGSSQNSHWYSRSMGFLGITIAIFLVIHMSDFYYKSRIATPAPGVIQVIDANGTLDLYGAVRRSFSQGWYSALYVLFMVGLAFHLAHGFRSAFQTLGLSHQGYALLVRRVGIAFAILVPLAFASIPVYLYFGSQN